MEVQLPKGKYVVAVSGGVDSVVLLDVLNQQSGLQLVVAHFDHGIRKDSGEDKKFVENLARKYKLPFEYQEGKLGTRVSEATARKARYEFLEKVMSRNAADAIITAHHQDDVIETAIINLLRGTGRKGLTALSSQKKMVRPLLGTPKRAILKYARDHTLEWHEDSTNTDTRYLRNYVRHELVPKLSVVQRQRLLAVIESQRSVNAQLDELLSLQLWSQADTIERKGFIALKHSAAREVMAAWLRTNGVREFDRQTIERAVVGAKTAKSGQKIALKKDVFLEVNRENLALTDRER